MEGLNEKTSRRNVQQDNTTKQYISLDNHRNNIYLSRRYPRGRLACRMVCSLGCFVCMTFRLFCPRHVLLWEIHIVAGRFMDAGRFICQPP